MDNNSNNGDLQTQTNFTPLTVDHHKLRFPFSRIVLALIGFFILIIILYLSLNTYLSSKKLRKNQLANNSTKISIFPSSAISMMPIVSISEKSSTSSSPTPSTPKSTPTVTITKTQPTATVAPTKRVSNPPQMNISYPSENQSITLTNSQQFCVVDVPVGGDQSGLQRRQNVNSTGWSGYSSVTTLCFSPNEGQNTISLQYRNSYSEESSQYDRHFSFHRQQEITVTLNGRLYSDNNCNANWDSGEGNVNGSANVNIFKMPEFYILGTVSSNNDGTFNSFSFSKVIYDSESLAVQAIPVSPSGYKSNIKYSPQTVTLNKYSNNYTVNIPQVPNENISACW